MGTLPRIIRVLCTAGLFAVSGAGAADEIGDPFFQLAQNGQSAAAIVVPEDDVPIWAEASAMIGRTLERWGGVRPEVVRLARKAPLPPGNVILLGTPETSETIAELTAVTKSPISRLAFADPHGYAVDARSEGDSKRLIIAGRSPRGAYNGAVYCRDFLLDAGAAPPGKADVFVRSASLLRSPALKARGSYHITIYEIAPQYTAEDWMKIIDRYAEDGLERVYFWLSGHHPSQKYPELYDVSGAKGTKLTVEGVRKLIRYCRDRDIKFYIGGGVFAWIGVDKLADKRPEIAAVGTESGGLCPSKEFARTACRDHLLEMYDTWPEADGFYLEIRDEYGECRCADCQVKLDEFGSKAYGRAEITWLQEFAREAWKRNPKLRFAWAIGYDEHKSDVSYYEQVRRMSDPRFEWVDARIGGGGKPRVLPGPGKVGRPFAYFSRQILHWDQIYNRHIDSLHSNIQGLGDAGLYGYIFAFEPGFGSSSYYSYKIPFPVDLLPYALTGFVYREMTWEPSLPYAELVRRIHGRFFSSGAPERFGEELIQMHRFSVNYADLIQQMDPRTIEAELKRIDETKDEEQKKQAASKLPKNLLKKFATMTKDLARMEAIEGEIEKATPGATPKTREGMALLRRMIEDTRRLYKQAFSDPAKLEEAIRRLEKSP